MATNAKWHYIELGSAGAHPQASEGLRGLLSSPPFRNSMGRIGSHVIVACCDEGPGARRVYISGLARSWLRPIPRSHRFTITGRVAPLSAARFGQQFAGAQR